MASTKTFRIALQVLSARTNPYNPDYGKPFASPLPPLIEDEHELDSRRAQSQSIRELVADFSARQDARKKEGA
jgi:hypothetical protein